MQHRRQPIPAYSGASVPDSDDKHAKHLQTRTRNLRGAAAVIGFSLISVWAGRAVLFPSLEEVEVLDVAAQRASVEEARPQYVHPLDDRSATRRAVEASAAALRKELARAYGQAQARVRARKNRAAPPPQPSEKLRPARAVAALAAKGAVAGGEVIDGTTRRKATDLLVARVDAMRDEAARQAAIDVPGAARDAYQENAFCDAVPAAKAPRTLRVASLNLWQPAADSWPKRRAALARLLKDADVDVVALQEVRGKPRWVDQLQEACNARGLAFAYSRYVPGTGGAAGGAKPQGWAEEGVGILSRFPLPREEDSLAPMPPSAPVWKSNFRRPTPSTRSCLRSCICCYTPSTRRCPRHRVCSMAWRFAKVSAIVLRIT